MRVGERSAKTRTNLSIIAGGVREGTSASDSGLAARALALCDGAKRAGLDSSKKYDSFHTAIQH